MCDDAVHDKSQRNEAERFMIITTLVGVIYQGWVSDQ